MQAPLGALIGFSEKLVNQHCALSWFPRKSALRTPLNATLQAAFAAPGSFYE